MQQRNKFLRKPKGNIDIDSLAHYELYNLRDSPFPSQPYVNMHASDDRYNGQIYEEEIRENEYKKIETNFLKVPQTDMNHIRLGFIMDTSYIGRGNGKSAFCVNLNNKINSEFCLDISDEVNKCFGLYITPEVKGKTKSFDDVSTLIFDGLIDSRIIEYSLAMLRGQAILHEYPGFDLDNKIENEEDFISKMNDINWFENENLKIDKLTNFILSNEYLKDIGKEFPLYFDKSRFNFTGLISQNNFVKFYKQLKKSQEKYDFIFNDLVALFLASGFNGSYLILDDFERIPYHQSEKQKREFALDIRTNLFDGIRLNSKIGFYNFLLIFHAGVPRLIEKSWGNSGMEQRCPVTNINRDSKHVVFFEKMDSNNAILMIKKYLEEYRIDKQDEAKSGLYPFSEDAIKKIGEMSEFNASQILRSANQVLDKAAQEKIESISADFVKNILNPEEQDEDEIKTDIISDDKYTDLINKAKDLPNEK